MKKVILLYVLLHLSWSFSQITFYQDIFKGGVTADGFSVGTGEGGGSIDLSIPTNCTIKKGYLFCGRHGKPNDLLVDFNGYPLLFDESIKVSIHFDSPVYGGEDGGSVHMIDVTNIISPLINTYSISIPNQGILGNRYVDFYLVVLYEDPLLNQTSITILINSNDIGKYNNYNLSNLFPIDVINDVGLAIHGGYMCDTLIEPTLVYIEGSYLGKLGGNDSGNLNICAGVVGSFEYVNSTLNGLNDDNSDFQVKGSDGLSNISSLLSTGTTTFDVLFESISNTSQDNETNSIWSIVLTYTSPCSAFPTQTSSDTTLCFGTTAQLFASGGTSTGSAPAYEWQPAVGLSCTNCPNPIVTTDSSRLYTVRIRNNDSCSVVRPIKVNVKPLPEFSSVVSKPSICGAATGQILLGADYVGETYSINGGTQQTSGTFSNLSAGTYTVSLHELNGCTRDTLVVVGDTSITQAYFTATPQSGAAPLWVQFSNQNTNANDFSWSVNGEPQGGNLSSFTFDTNGVYTVELVAWQFDPSCADTFSVLISVYDSLVVQIPNVFTPNHDGNNDFFGVTVNRPCAISFSILNRWGNIIQSGTVPTLGGFVPLWSGSNAPDGTYFYQIELQADDLKQVEKREGFVELRE